jgi:hypothetical protein
MTELHQLVEAFTQEERSDFIQYLKKKNKRSDTKNIHLFKLLCDSKTYTIAELSQNIYGKTSNKGIYALRKRLFASMIDYSANTALEHENSIEMKVAKYLLAARRLMIGNCYRIGFKILDKAEKTAKDYHLYTFLNEIYHTKLEYAYQWPSIEIESVIDDLNKNKKLKANEESLNVVYAKIKVALQSAQQKGDIIDFEKLVDRIFKEQDLKLEQDLTFKFLYQLVSIVNISAFAKKDYFRIEHFLLKAFDEIKNHKSRFYQPNYHIEIVFIIANTLFRNKKFEKSESYLDLMIQLMDSEKKKYYKAFEFKYNLLKGLNLHYKGACDQAISLFETQLKKQTTDIIYKQDMRLGLVMFYFHTKAYRKANRQILEFTHTDSWYISKFGHEWTIKKNLIDIILQLELGKTDLFEIKLLSFRRQYSDYLKQIKQNRVLVYLKLIEEYYKNPEAVTSPVFYENVEQSFDWKHYEDIFVMSFYAWLKSKMQKRDLFDVTKDIIKSSMK